MDLAADEAWGRLTGPHGIDGRWLRGRRFDDQPPVQVATVLDDPDDAVLRVSIEPTHGEEGARDVTLFLAAWGPSADADRLVGLRSEWAETLERAFPEGRAP